MDQRIGMFKVGASRLAYATMGDGPPLVFPPASIGHLALELEEPAIRDFYEALASRFTLVRYDRLGTGLSDRDRPPKTLTLEFEVDALETLFDARELGRAHLFGFGYGAVVAAAFAARRPDRVKRLLLYGAYADGGPLRAPEVLGPVTSVLRADWELGSRLLAEAFLPDANRELAKSYARLRRDSTSGETAASLLELWARTDLREVLHEITAPTLLLHRLEDPVVPIELASTLAALIPGARLQTLEGSCHQPWFGDPAAVLSAAGVFLNFTPPRSTVAAGAAPAPQLTPREREVLRLVADGLDDASIAQELLLSAHTVHRHMANIRTRLRQPSRAAAVALAARRGLI